MHRNGPTQRKLSVIEADITFWIVYISHGRTTAETKKQSPTQITGFDNQTFWTWLIGSNLGLDTYGNGPYKTFVEMSGNLQAKLIKSLILYFEVVYTIQRDCT